MLAQVNGLQPSTRLKAGQELRVYNRHNRPTGVKGRHSHQPPPAPVILRRSGYPRDPLPCGFGTPHLAHANGSLCGPQKGRKPRIGDVRGQSRRRCAAAAKRSKPGAAGARQSFRGILDWPESGRVWDVRHHRPREHLPFHSHGCIRLHRMTSPPLGRCRSGLPAAPPIRRRCSRASPMTITGSASRRVSAGGRSVDGAAASRRCRGRWAAPGLAARRGGDSSQGRGCPGGEPASHPCGVD